MIGLLLPCLSCKNGLGLVHLNIEIWPLLSNGVGDLPRRIRSCRDVVTTSIYGEDGRN